jgi:hypothetical protein
VAKKSGALNRPATRSTAPSRGAPEGALLAVTPAGIVGWARDPERPDVALQVVLLAEERPVATGLADRFEIDLVRHRVGPGIPGFVIRLPAMPVGRFPMRLALREAGGTALGAPLFVARAQDLAPSVDLPATAYEGRVEGLRDGFVFGWAWNSMMPDVALELELFDGGERIARTTANQPRADLADAGKRDGACGFAFPLPVSLLDGAPHTLRVLVADTRNELAGGPIGFGQQAVMPLIEEVARLRIEVDRLRGLVDGLIGPDSMVLRELVRTVTDRVYAYGEVQRELVERELDALRALALDPGTPVTDAPATPPTVAARGRRR